MDIYGYEPDYAEEHITNDEEENLKQDTESPPKPNTEINSRKSPFQSEMFEKTLDELEG